MSSLAQPRFMVSGQSAVPPAGFLDFCARSPQDCGLKVAAASATDAAVPAVAVVAPPRPPRGGYDWSSAFAANRAAAQPNDQVAALRQQLYAQYMWKAAFAAARPANAPAAPPAPASPAFETAPAMADTLEAPSMQTAALYDSGVARSAIWGSRAPELRAAAPAALAEAPTGAIAGSEPYLIRTAFASLAQADAVKASAVVDADAEPRLSQPAAPAAPAITDQTAPASAALAPAAPQPLALTPALMSRLTAVDRSINDRIIQTEDIRLYGQEDYWATPLEDGGVVKGRARGDCEDYALEKRRALIAAGVPAADLSIAVADTRYGPHAVLLVDTDKGEYVLDSLTGKIVSWDRTGYHWIKRQAWGDPMAWVAIAADN